MTTITNVLENLTQNRPTIHVATVCGFLCLFFPSFSTRSRWFRSVFAGWASPFVEALIFFYGSSHLPSFYSPSVYVVLNVAGRHRTLSEEEQTKENWGNHHFGERRQSAKLCPHKAFYMFFFIVDTVDMEQRTWPHNGCVRPFANTSFFPTFNTVVE